MKPYKVKEARKILFNSKCTSVRISNGHEIFKRKDYNTFALPINHRIVSPGVMRKLFKFVAEN